MARITYNPQTGSVGSYEPRFRSIDPDSFMAIVDEARQRAQTTLMREQALSTSPNITPVGSSFKADKGTRAFLQQMDTNSAVRKIRKDGPDAYFKGKHRSELSPQLRKLYDQVQKQKKESGFKEDLVGGLGRVLDVMMRFNYGSAEATKRVWEKSMESDDDSWLENLGEAFADAGKGWWGGFTGKNKTTFSQVLQRMQDSAQALQDGKDPNKVKYGYAELDGSQKFAKGALGFILDVALDPTTYIGLGAVKVAMGAGKYSKNTINITKEIDELGDQLFDGFGVRLPEGFVPGGEESKDALKAYLAQGNRLDSLAGLPHNAAARSARLQNAELFASHAKATVMATQTARYRQLITEARQGDFKPVPSVESSVSGPKFMDVPASTEDLAAYHRYTRFVSDNSRARAGLDPQKDAAKIAQLDRELATAQKRFDDYFNVSEINVEALAKTNARVLEHPDIKSLDQQIRVKRDAVRKLSKRPNKTTAVNKTLAREKAELDELVARREARFVELMEDAAVKVAPDKGTLVSKLRRESDISILRQLANSTVDDGVEHANVLRRELSYRFAEKGDKWLAGIVQKAGSLSDGLVEDIKNLTPLNRPAKHTIKRRQIVQVEQPKNVPSPSEIAKAEAYNRRIAREIEQSASRQAAEIADGVEEQLWEILVRETTPNFKRGLSVKINMPLLSKNTPQTAKVLFTMQLPDAVVKAVSKYVFRDTFKEGLQRWSNFFKASAGIDPLLNSMRLAYNGGANFRIEEHAKRLRKIFSDVAPANRRAAFRQWIKYGHLVDENTTGPYAELVREINNEILNLTRVFDETYPNGVKVTIADYNGWLPEKMQLQKLNPTDAKNLTQGSPEWLRASLRHLPEDTDPADLLWYMNIAREKVLVRTAMKDNVMALFGLERTADNEKRMNTLIKKYGYKEVPELGNGFVFPPDIADDITKTFDLMKNQKQVNELINFYDKVLTVYKSTVTMYNPGYHMRNSFGDSFMNYLAGVSGKTGYESYQQSAKVIKALKGIGDDNPVYAALMDINPKAAFNSIENAPKTVLFKHRGKDVTAEQVWVLYNHYGLHAGFVSNEFGTTFAKQGSIRASAVGKRAGKVNRAVQTGSEYREDFFRLAHFIHAIKNSKNPNVDAAAFEAAASVRKYLFDYSDFTQIEKAVMLRLIPFYKWTRKAIPLMAETLFAQPGKALMYPKAMRNISTMLGYDLGDSNGVIPSSDAIIPEWVRDRGMWPLGEQDGNTVMGDMALPFNDIVRTVNKPIDSFFSMLTPGVRVPVELQMGQRFYGNIPINDTNQYAMSVTPQGSFLNQMLRKNEEGEASGIVGNLTDPRTIQFLTGIGLHENTERQMKNELMNQSFEASKRKRDKEKK